MEYYVGLDVSLKQTSICVVIVLRHHAEGTPLPRREQWARQG